MAVVDSAARMEDVDLSATQDIPVQPTLPPMPIYPTSRTLNGGDDFLPLVTVVDFHHARYVHELMRPTVDL